MNRKGEQIVFATIVILLGIIGYKVIGWWAPGVLLASFAVGTFVNWKYDRDWL